MIGWKILKEGEYKVDLPILSAAEEKIILSCEESFRQKSRDKQPIIGQDYQGMKSIVLEAATKEGFYLNKNQIAYLCEVAHLHTCGYAFIDKLLEDQTIEEISIIGLNRPAYVYVRNEGWKSVNATFETETILFDIINKMGQKLGKHITLQNPRLDTMLPDGSRLHASLNPISNGEITIRKFRYEPFSLGELCKNQTIDPKVAAFLSIIMQSDRSLIVCGNTASGKTTTLNSLFSFVPENDRVIITEETPEINIPHPHQLRMIANRDLEINLESLVHDTMRMRPDRLIVGEVRRKDEFIALFEVLLSGQARGSYATMHAQSATDGISRMKNMGINEQDIESIDCIIVQKRMQKYDPKTKVNVEIRRLTQMAEVENGEVKIIYELGKTDGIYQSRLFDLMCGEFSLDKDEMMKYLKEREQLLTNEEITGLKYREYHQKIQQEIFGAT